MYAVHIFSNFFCKKLDICIVWVGITKLFFKMIVEPTKKDIFIRFKFSCQFL